jgi:hypothetical protein
MLAMRKFIFLSVVASAVLLAAVLMSYSFGASGVSEIRALAKRGADETALIAVVEKSRQPYKLSADDIISLKKDGVPDVVVVKMIQHKP